MPAAAEVEPLGTRCAADEPLARSPSQLAGARRRRAQAQARKICSKAVHSIVEEEDRLGGMRQERVRLAQLTTHDGRVARGPMARRDWRAMATVRDPGRWADGEARVEPGCEAHIWCGGMVQQ